MRSNGGSTIFTTQTMTEAEVLCDRIAIMVNGGLCCITEIENLKKLVGGYHLIVNKKSYSTFDKKSSFAPIESEDGKSRNSEDLRLVANNKDDHEASKPNRIKNGNKPKISQNVQNDLSPIEFEEFKFEDDENEKILGIIF